MHAFDGVDFGEAAEIKLMMPPPKQPAYGIIFTLKLHVHTNDEREELEGLFEFVKYIDQYPDMFVKAVRQTLEDYLGKAAEFADKRDKEYLDGTRMKRLVAFSNPSKMPKHWNMTVRTKFREMGRGDIGSESSSDRYEWQKQWQDLSDPRIGRTSTGEWSTLSPEQHDRAISLGMRYRAYMRG